MPLKEFLDSLSLSRTGARNLETLCLLIQATINAIEFVEPNSSARRDSVREFTRLGNKVKQSLKDRSRVNASAQKQLCKEYKTELDNGHRNYLNSSSSRQVQKFSDAYRKILIANLTREGLSRSIAQKAFEESVVGAVQSAERAPKPDEFNLLKRFIELFSPAQKTSDDDPQPEADPRRSDLTGSVHDSDLGLDGSIQTDYSTTESIPEWDSSYHVSQSMSNE